MTQPTVKITSAQNPLFKEWLRISQRGRLADGSPILPVEGPKMTGEALRGGWIPRMAAAAAECQLPGFRNIPRMILDERLLAKLGDTESPQSPVVLFEAPTAFSHNDETKAPGRRAVSPRIAIADGIQDPGNLGALVRSAWAFGFTDFAVTEGGARLLTPKTLRASAGGLFHIRLRESMPASSWRDLLLAQGYLVLVLEAGGAISINEVPWREPLAVVIGNEAHGPSPQWFRPPNPATVESAEKNQPAPARGEVVKVRIPIDKSCESLNAAMAGAIAFYAAATKSPASP